MFDPSQVARFRYLPSGKLDGFRFSLGLILLVLTSVVSGIVAGILYSQIAIVPILSYLTVLVPLAISVPLAWFVAKFVRFSHCRNLWAAALVGAVCGVVTFLSACHSVGTVTTMREDTQATFVAAATRTDQIQRTIYSRVFEPRRQQPERNKYSLFNIPQSMMLLIEFGVLIWIPAKSGRNFARQAYAEAIDCWLDRSIILAIPGSGDKIISVLEADEFLVQTLSSIQLCSTDPRLKSRTSSRRPSYQRTGKIAATWMLLEVSPFAAANGAFEAYLSATEIDTHGKKRPLFQQLKLRSHEIASARKLFMESSTDRQTQETSVENEQELRQYRSAG